MLLDIKTDLTNTCSFLSVFSNTDDTRHPATEMGYMRADLNHGRWFYMPFVVHEALNEHHRAGELMEVTDALVEEFQTLDALAEFCKEHAEKTSDPAEWNLYYTGSTCYFWIRVITREQDYNFFVHAYVKQGGT